MTARRHAGAPVMTDSQRPNPHRLTRDPQRAMLAGVCAGLADYFGFDLKGLRLVVAILTLVFSPFVITSYVVLALVLPKKEGKPTLDQEQATFWREVSNRPADVFGGLRHRFRALDLRLQRMEAFVTSPQFRIDRELKRPSDIEGSEQRET